MKFLNEQLYSMYKDDPEGVFEQLEAIKESGIFDDSDYDSDCETEYDNYDYDEGNTAIKSIFS